MHLTRHIGAAEAHILIEAAAAKAEAMGVPQNIAVVDGAGHLVAFRRMDGAKFMAIEIAINKAFTAAGARRPHADAPRHAHAGPKQRSGNPGGGQRDGARSPNPYRQGNSGGARPAR